MFALSFVIPFLVSLARAQSKSPAIIPAPLSFMATTGTLKVSDGAVISFPSGDADAGFAAQFLAGVVQRTRGIKLTPRAESGQAPNSALVVFRRKSSEGAMKKDSYDLQISPEDVQIEAAIAGGYFTVR